MSQPQRKHHSPGLEDLFLLSDEQLPLQLHRAHPTFSPNLPSNLLLSLLPVEDRLTMRLVSKAAANWVHRHAGGTFQKLYIAPATRCKSLEHLASLGVSCSELVIRLERSAAQDDDSEIVPPHAVLAESSSTAQSSNAQPSSTSSQPSQPPSASAQTPSSGKEARPSRPRPLGQDPIYWTHIFAHLPNLSTLTISGPVHDPGWCGLNATENIIISIRTAIEKSSLPHLTTLRLSPIYAMGLLHFRWAGGSAFRDASWTAGPIWRRITTIELNLTNPFANLSKSQSKIFRKVLHDYLASFAKSLKVLRFGWVGGEGPNPMALDLSAKEKDFSAPPIRWSELVELRLGGVRVTDVAVQVMKSRAMALERLLVQEPFFLGTDSEIVYHDGGTFHDVILDRQGDDSVGGVLGSVEETADEAGEEGGDVFYEEDDDALSDTSLELPFVLQL